MISSNSFHFSQFLAETILPLLLVFSSLALLGYKNYDVDLLPLLIASVNKPQCIIVFPCYLWQDLEQLLNFIGVKSLGPRHILANLKELLRIIQSADYIDK